MTSVMEHPLWPTLLPLLRAEVPVRPAPHRIEVDDPHDKHLLAQLLRIEVECAAQCGALVHPVRVRASWSTLYLSVACELSVNVGCSRTDAAHDEVDRIVAAIQHYDDPTQPNLFEAR